MEPVSAIAERLARLEQELAQVRARLARLERREDAPERSTAPAAPPEPLVGDRWRGVPALAGRSCLAMGGAFVFRSLTESGAFSPALGVALGSAYALAWLILADRAAARGLQLSGAFHALVSALIVFPLLFEATTRFALLPPVVAAMALGAVTAAGLAVAWRRSFHTVAWITESAALAVAVLLLFRSHAVLPFTGYLLALAVASLVLAYRRGWRGQRWLVALALDAVVLLVGALRLVGEAPPDWLTPGAVLTAQIGLAAVYLGAFTLRLLFQGRGVTLFAVTQTVLVVLVGFEAALRVAAPAPRQLLAAAALGFALLLHAVLARRSERRYGHGAAVGYFASLATFLAAESVRVLAAPALFPLVWGVAAAALAGLALAAARPILELHASLLAVGAAMASGLLGDAARALLAPAVRFPALWPLEVEMTLALVVLTAVMLELAGRGEPAAGRIAGVARVVALATALVAAGGWIVERCAPLVAGAAEGLAAGRLAVLRSAVLAVAAIALAAGSATGARVEWRRHTTASA